MNKTPAKFPMPKIRRKIKKSEWEMKHLLNPLKSLLIEGIFLVIMVLGMILFWEDLFVSFIFAVVLTIIAFIFFHKKEDITFFIVGVVIGFATELIGTQFGIWAHSNPGIIGVPFWVPFIYGFAFLLARRIRDTVFKLEHEEIHYFHSTKLTTLWGMFYSDILIFIAALCVMVLLWPSNSGLFLILGAMLGGTLIYFKLPSDMFFAVFSAVIGAIVEIICVSAGVWTWSNPGVFGVPVWVPFGYAILALIVRRISALFTIAFFKQKSA